MRPAPHTPPIYPETTRTPASATPPSLYIEPATAIRLSLLPSRKTAGNSEPVKQALKDLAAAIGTLKDAASPDFSDLLRICEQLKIDENLLKQAQCDTEARRELHQLRTLLPSLFRQLERCLDIHRDTPLDIGALQTLCMGLSALAAPLPGPLLTGAQCQAARPLLTSLSNKLAAQLSAQFEHQVADVGLLLNCLNWFSRALKADLLQADQPAVAALFQSALAPMHRWSELGNAAHMNSRQLAKCLVQLNTMIRQKLIDTDPASPDGSANRSAWIGCVHHLCRHFLSHDQWLPQCSGVELINVTNTLKDGLDLGLLDARDPALRQSFDHIAARIRTQTFSGPGGMTTLSNCGNFLRCLFEHKLLGGPDSSTGEAVRFLVSEIGRLHQHGEFPGHQAQALVNLASFLKAADRWLSGQSRATGEDVWSPLANATDSLIAVLYRQGAGERQWMQSPQSGSALLWALQHLAQRGLVRGQAVPRQQTLVGQLLEAIPRWQANAQHSPSILQSLRALMSLANGKAAQPDLPQTAVFRQALSSLLDQLQQSPPAQLSDDERLASLQAVRTAVTLGVLSLDDVQPLLQRLLKTTAPVDLARLEQAIAAYGEPMERVEPSGEPAPAPVAIAVSDQNPVPAHGATYWTDQHAPQPASAVSDGRRAQAGNDDWITPRPIASPSAVALASIDATLPTLVSRPADNDPDSSLATTKKVRAAPAGPVQAKPAAAANKENSGASLAQIQKEWFTLVTRGDAKALPRLQQLADSHPGLLNQKSPGKKGQVALFYALTHGRKDIVAWLVAHERQRLDIDLGAFLLDAIDQIGMIEKRHVAAIRLLIDAAVKRYDQKISDAHAQQMPDAQPLSRRALLERRAVVFSDAQKTALSQSAPLAPLFEEYKLILPNRLASGTVLPATRPAAANTLVRPIATRALPLAPTTTQGLTPLMEAAKAGDTEAVKAILGAARNKDELAQARLKNGSTALIIAAANGDDQTVTAILEGVTDKDTLAQMQDSWGMTALMRAAIGGQADTAAAILNAVRDKDGLAQMRDKTGMTALLSAALSDRAAAATALLNGVEHKDALAQMTDKNRLTALSCATLFGHVASVDAILDGVEHKDALVQVRDVHGTNALMHAATASRVDLVQKILTAVDDKDTLAQMFDGGGTTALMRSVSAGSIESAMAILNNVSKKHELAQQRDTLGLTAAMKAVTQGHPAIAAAISDALKG